MLEKEVSKRLKASELLLHKLFQHENKKSSEDSNFEESTSASPLNKPIQPKGIKNINPAK